MSLRTLLTEVAVGSLHCNVVIEHGIGRCGVDCSLGLLWDMHARKLRAYTAMLSHSRQDRQPQLWYTTLKL
jgi:hypothetical protein